MDTLTDDQQTQQQPPPPPPPQAQRQTVAPIQTTSPQTDETIPQQPMQNMNVLPVTQVKRGGLAGIIDEFRDAMAGPAPGKIYQDADGNQYVRHPDSNGSKWMRVIGKTMAGAAAGLAAGRGAGNGGRAMLAGVNEGREMADRQKANDQAMNEQVRQAQLDKFNTIKLQHDLAAQNFEMTRREIAASREDVQYAQDQLARELKPQDQGGYGSIDAGVYPDHLALADIKNIHPDFWKRVYTADPNADSDVRQYPEFDADGKRVGIHVVIRTHDVSKEMADDDAKFAHYTPDPKGVGPGSIDWVKPSGPTTNGQIETWSSAAFKAHNADLLNFQNLVDKKKNDALRDSEIYKNDAEAAKARSDMNAAVPADVQADISEGLASGRYLMGKDLPLRTMKDQTTAAQYTKAADDYSRTHYGLPYSPEIIRQESRMAEAPHTQAFLNGIDRMIGAPGIPGQLDQVLDLARRAGIGKNAPLNELKLWVKQRMGSEASKNFEQGLSDTQTALGTLIGNPLLGSGESDLKLKTAQRQFGSDPTMQDLQGAVKTTKEILERARAQLARNNRYIQQRYGDSYSPQAQNQAPPRPANVPASATWNAQANNGRGMWVPQAQQ